MRDAPAMPGGEVARQPGNGTLEAAAFAGAGRDKGTWICVLPKRRPAAHRRSLKKCTSKKFEFPPTHEPISGNTPRSNQFLERGKTIFHRGFTGPTRSQ